ncbi:MAG: glycosyltransferase [Candidatus Eisenbacteria bacterium]|nr:glycosyltransferase [Candidatus Eisenbacteria bacterium]
MPPTISVIVPTRGRPALLADALASVAAQEPAPLELRVAVDGAPPDVETLPDLPMLAVTVLAVRFGQPGAARNAAARGAVGDVLAFLDDDDRWRPGHLAGLVGAFADPGVGFAWRDAEVIRERVREDGVRESLESVVLAREWDEERMRTDDYLPPSAWGVRRELFERLGGFDESFAASEDWDFALRAAGATRVRRVPGVTVEVRMREQGNASSDFGAVRRECLAKLAARHGLPALSPKTFWEVARELRERR